MKLDKLETLKQRLENQIEKSIDTIIEFKISERNYGETNLNLLKGIPEQVPLN